MTIVWSLKHKNTQPLYIFNRENPQNSEPQNGPRRGLDFIALIFTVTFLEKLLEIPLLYLPDRVVSEIGDCNYPLIAGDGFCDDEVELES